MWNGLRRAVLVIGVGHVIADGCLCVSARYREKQAGGKEHPDHEPYHAASFVTICGMALNCAASSMVRQTLKTVCSSHALPMTCNPSGRPSDVSPAGTAMPGRPARLTETVNTSFRYILI